MRSRANKTRFYDFRLESATFGFSALPKKLSKDAKKATALAVCVCVCHYLAPFEAMSQ